MPQSSPRARDGVHADVSRRDFVRDLTGAGLAVGLTAPGALAARPAAATGTTPGEPRAKAVIQIFLSGGLSHIDSFDPKPGAPVDVRGDLEAIPSKIDGEPFSQLLRRTAAIADKISVIRSMTHSEAAHERGTHNMLTGYRPSPAILYPSMGSVVSHELGNQNNLPAYVAIPRAHRDYGGTGYLSSAFAPFSLGSDPGNRGFRVRDLNSPKGVDDTRLARRRQLLHDLDAGFADIGDVDAVTATHTFYDQAYALIESPEARAAFDLTKEKKSMRDRYGTVGIGPRLLLARRMVQAGVRYVTVTDGGWDHHSRIYAALGRQLPRVDQAFAALVADLDSLGMLDDTMVLLTTEFGRTSRVNSDQGRDHWPKVFSVAAAGGGIRRGYVHGASNADGAEPDRDPVTPPDLAATLFHLMGIDPEKKLLAPGDRPIDIVRDGQVIRELLA